MTNYKIWAMSALAMVTIYAPTASADNGPACNLYANMAGAMYDFMEPLDVQSRANLMAGEDQQLIQKLSVAMLNALTQGNKNLLALISEEDAALLGESAAQNAIQYLMTPQNVTQDVRTVMNTHCLKTGPGNLVAMQRNLRAATLNQNPN